MGDVLDETKLLTITAMLKGCSCQCGTEMGFEEMLSHWSCSFFGVLSIDAITGKMETVFPHQRRPRAIDSIDVPITNLRTFRRKHPSTSAQTILLTFSSSHSLSSLKTNHASTEGLPT